MFAGKLVALAEMFGSFPQCLPPGRCWSSTWECFMLR